jgi:hypothetical protein
VALSQALVGVIVAEMTAIITGLGGMDHSLRELLPDREPFRANPGDHVRLPGVFGSRRVQFSSPCIHYPCPAR